MAIDDILRRDPFGPQSYVKTGQLPKLGGARRAGNDGRSRPPAASEQPLSEGQYRNIIRAQGVGGSAQIALARQMRREAKQMADDREARLTSDLLRDDLTRENIAGRQLNNDILRLNLDEARREQPSPGDVLRMNQGREAMADSLSGIALEKAGWHPPMKAPDDPYLGGALRQFDLGRLDEGEKLLKMAPEPLDMPRYHTDPESGQRWAQFGRSVYPIREAKSPDGGKLELVERDGFQFYRTEGGSWRLMPDQSGKNLSPAEIYMLSASLKSAGYDDAEIRAEIERRTGGQRNQTENGAKSGSSEGFMERFGSEFKLNKE